MIHLADWRRAGAYKGLCSLSVKGADKHVPLLPGGLDGRYKLRRCEGGRPAYVREKSPPARAHSVWDLPPLPALHIGHQRCSSHRRIALAIRACFCANMHACSSLSVTQV